MPVGVSAYVPLANVTLSSSAASVTFSSISQAYRDLVLVASNIQSSASANMFLRINNNSTSLYSWVRAQGNGSNPDTSSVSSQTALYFSETIFPTSTTYGQFIIHFMDYSTTNKHKSILTRSDFPSSGTLMSAARFASNSALTSVTFSLDGGNTYSAGSTFALYGIAA